MSDWAALFVGIDNYPLGATLKHAVTDAVALSDAFGFDKFPLNTLFLSPSPKPEKLSKDRIHQSQEEITVKKLRKSVKALMNAEQANILFYFSGHANMNWERYVAISFASWFINSNSSCSISSGPLARSEFNKLP